MYFDILNDDMVGFANTSAREMLDHLFPTYGSINDVDLEHNFGAQVMGPPATSGDLF
jgi:hypothetical protein